MKLINTADLPVLEKRPGWSGRLIHSESMTFAHWDFRAGSSIHEHSHDQEEVWHVLEGQLELTVSGQTHVAGPGWVAVVPRDALHSVRALTDGKAIVADHPVRPDFK